MNVSIKGFIYHKTAERYSDCFDRFAVNMKTNKFSVSDGVSKSFFPGIWAQLLTNTFVSTEGRVNLFDNEALKSLQNKWVAAVEEIVSRPGQKYFVRNLFAQGRSAAATFVGLHFYRDGKKYQWEAFAIGDSFLFFVPHYVANISNHFEKVTFLSSKKDFAFDNFPDFFDSRDKVNKGNIKQKKHELEPGTFYVMTDALSQWFINEKQQAIQEINSWKSQQDFEKRIRQLRNTSLQNDDVAILIIEVEKEPSTDLHYKDVLLTNFNDLLEIEKTVLEKQEIEWREIERQLLKKYKEITVEEENKLLSRKDEERRKAKEQLYKWQQDEKARLKAQLLRRHEEEKIEFEYQMDGRQKREFIELEEQLDKKLDVEINELRKNIEKKLETEKSDKNKELTKRIELQEPNDTKGQDTNKRDDNKANFDSTKKSSFNDINYESSKSFEDTQKKSEKIEPLPDKEQLGKKRTLLEATWETTMEIGHITWDAVSNLIHPNEKEDKEKQAGNITDNQEGGKLSNEGKKNEKFDSKKKGSQKTKKDDDISSITDKF